MFSAAAAAVKEQIRGVYCIRSGKPVRLSAGLTRREASIRNEPAEQQQLQSRVFLHGVDPAVQRAFTLWTRS